jgi:fatty-acyl-CoA synthase
MSSSMLSEVSGPPSPPVEESVVADVLRRAARLGPQDRVLTVLGDGGARSWTAAELLRDAGLVAGSLLDRHPAGSRIATCLPNGTAPALLQLGVALAGMVLVPINPRSRPVELEHCLRLSRAVRLYAAPGVAGADALPDLREVVAVAGDGAAVVPDASGDVPDLPEVDPESLAQVQFTSGTTGRPKGVRITHRGMVLTSAAFADRIGLPEGGVWLNPMPLFHTAGNVLGVMGAMWQRAEHVVLPFEPAAVLRAVEERAATLLSAAPTLLSLLMEHPAFDDTDLSSLEVVFTGGSTLSPRLVDTIEQRFGAPLSTTFGMTETCGCAVQTSPLVDDADTRRTTAGRPVAGTQVRVVVRDEVVPLGETGELQVRGERLTRGYLDAPEATAELLDPDGWLRTGDLGQIDAAGRVRIVGRLKDMIKTGGENVSPEEVEDCLTRHPTVSRAAVVGAPDDRWGELVVAFVVPATGVELDPVALEAHCRSLLSGFKVPRRWYEVAELPTTASSKVQRAELRRRAAAG